MSAASDLIQQARADLDREYPKAWVPHEQGNPTEIAGIVKRLELANTRQYGPKRVVIIEDEHGVEWSIWLLHTALVTQFTRVRPAAGEAVAVRYLGKRMNQAGTTEYDDYRVASLRAEGSTLDWDAITEPSPAGGGAPSPGAAVQQAAAATPQAAAAPISGVPCPSCGGPPGYHSTDCPYNTPF